MLQLSSSHRQSPDIAERGRGGLRRAAWVLAGIGVLLAIAAGFWAIYHDRTAPRAIRIDIGSRPPPLPALKQGYLPIDTAKAEEVNAGIALSTAPNEAARPFVLPAVTIANLPAHQSAIDCLTAAVYYEAASESDTGQRAVAQVVLNRVRHPAFPKSVCGAVYEGSERRTGCQFSFTCDGSLARQPSPTGWARARSVAQAALAGYVERSVGTATHYHATYVVPYWAWTLDKVNVIGAHIFYRWRGYWGRRAAFTGAYAGETMTEDQTSLSTLVSTEGVTIGDEVVTPLGPRPLADDIGTLGAAPAPDLQTAAPVRADNEKGTLAADEKAGTLVQPAPGAAAPAK